MRYLFKRLLMQVMINNAAIALKQINIWGRYLIIYGANDSTRTQKDKLIWKNTK